MAKETPNTKRLKEEKKLDKLSRFGVLGAKDNIVNKLFDSSKGYGTSRSAGALEAGGDEMDRIYKKERKTVGEVMDDKRPRQVMREAAAEERRESRGMKAGGYVRAADGCAKKGKTKGTMR